MNERRIEGKIRYDAYKFKVVLGTRFLPSFLLQLTYLRVVLA
jgi:hypothetical protein